MPMIHIKYIIIRLIRRIQEKMKSTHTNTQSYEMYKCKILIIIHKIFDVNRKTIFYKYRNILLCIL